MTETKPAANGKLARKLTAATSVFKAARCILAARLGTVRETVPAVATWGTDVEPVHRLRVAARRATAALDSFRDLLPARVYRKSRKALKRLRRAAGTARDADVFLASVRTFSVHQSPADRPGLHFLLGHAFAARQGAQARVVSALKTWESRDSGRANGLPDKLRRGDDAILADRAVPTLRQLLKKLNKTVQGNLDDPQRLHAARVCAKRLRYAVELFVDCYPDIVREQLSPRIEAVQDALGAANDSHQAVALLDGLLTVVRQTQPALWDTDRSGLETVRLYHVQRERDQRLAFWDAWRSWQALRPEVVLAEPTGPATPEPVQPAPRLAAL
jgi:CHAD domain-containing protein